MQFRIEPYEPRHGAAVVGLSLRAWKPVFESLQAVLNPLVYQAFYPEGWELSQQKAVEAVCADESAHVWVALDDQEVRGFVAVKLHEADSLGEIYMIAVDPAAQRRGIGRAMIHFALEWIAEAGMSLAMVETGGDPGHAPARQTYEGAGFQLFPTARYFKKL